METIASVFVKAAAALAEYERIARGNRPDWDEFVTEAQASPGEIVWEVCDVFVEVHGECTDDDTIVVHDMTRAWVKRLA